MVDVVVDVGFCLVADSNNDIDHDYDGHCRVPPSSATPSGTPIDEEFDIDNDYDCDIDLTVRPAHGLNTMLSRFFGQGQG